jgi:hypothetical protein
VARSLVPAIRNPRLIPFAVLNWVYGLAIQAFVREHLKSLEEQPAIPGGCPILERPAA